MKRIKELRQQHGMTLKDLSKASGVPVSVISEIERGVYKSPRVASLIKIARAFGVSVEDLVDPDDASA